MKSKLLLEIAYTMLRARLRQTIVAAVGVTFGITMFITLLGFMTGLNELLDGLVTNRTPHIRLYNEIEPNLNQPVNISREHSQSYNFVSSIKAVNSRKQLYNVDKILETLNSDTRVLGYSRKITSQVFFNDGVVDVAGMMNGIDIEPELQFYQFNNYVVGGTALDIQNVSNSIILGKPLAEKLFTNIGDVIQITTTTGDRLQLKVVGLYQSGIADFDKTQSFASIATVQKVLGKSANYITDVQIKLKDIKTAPLIGKEYASIFQTNAEDIQTANAQFETGSGIRSLISYAVGITLLIVAGFGIYNILNMMIYEKMDTIAILKATGFSGKDVKRIFMIISLSIGIVGCIGGLLFGNLLSQVIDRIPFNTAALPSVTTYPVSYNPGFYAIAVLFSIITTYAAGWLPARKASKIDPVDIIRGK